MKFSVALIVCFCVSTGLAKVVDKAITSAIFNLWKSQVCYDHYGCFSDDAPWTSFLRPRAGLPNPPYEVGTRFLLFTRSNRYEDFELMSDNEVILGFSPYNKTKQTVFLIHGFTDSHLSPWMVQAKNALLDKEDINVISVDWAPGAKRSYLRATNNARMVGAQLTRLLKFLVSKADLDLDRIRIIGHSIGAHAAGYVGEAFQGSIGHITALDPAGSYFDGTDIVVRLDAGDAKNVHVIHTNGQSLIGMGMKNSVGHVDVYPNGGKTQPGCSDTLMSLIGAIGNLISWDFEGAIGEFACSHVRAADYYVESIKSQCPFVAHKCDSYDDYQNGNCFSACAASGQCAILGYGAEKHSGSRGNYYLSTSDKSQYCMQTAQFDTNVLSSQPKTDGVLSFKIGYDGEISDKYVVFDGKMTAGQILEKWVHISSNIMTSPSVKPTLHARYERNGIIPILQPRYLKLDAITLYVVNEDLKLEAIHYSAVTLDAGTDSILKPLN